MDDYINRYYEISYHELEYIKDRQSAFNLQYVLDEMLRLFPTEKPENLVLMWKSDHEKLIESSNW